MLSLSHGLTGAFFASQFPTPFVYIPLAVASHYLEDWIPHWDVGTGLSNGKRKRKTALLLGMVDLFVTFSFVFWLWGWGSFSSENTIHIVAGTFAGLLPDFLEAPRNFLGWEPKFLRKINQFHESFHFSIPNVILGLIPQVILWGVIVWLA